MFGEEVGLDGGPEAEEGVAVEVLVVEVPGVDETVLEDGKGDVAEAGIVEGLFEDFGGVVAEAVAEDDVRLGGGEGLGEEGEELRVGEVFGGGPGHGVVEKLGIREGVEVGVAGVGGVGKEHEGDGSSH